MVSSFLSHLPRSLCLSSVPPSPPTWSLQGFPKQLSGGTRPLGPQAPLLSPPGPQAPLLSVPQTQGTQRPVIGTQTQNTPVSPQITSGPQPSAPPSAPPVSRPCAEGTSRRRKPEPQNSLPLTFSSLCPSSESVSLQPGSPGTGAAQPPSFSV